MNTIEERKRALLRIDRLFRKNGPVHKILVLVAGRTTYHWDAIVHIRELVRENTKQLRRGK